MSARPKLVTMIVAMDRDRAIGADNRLPWHLPADLRRFKTLTMGHHLIMGRKTFESITAVMGGKPLPGRTSIIVTRNKKYAALEGCIVAHSLEAALAAAAADDEVFVIGGAELFAQAMRVAGKLQVTEIDTRVGCGDCFFAPIDPARWKLESREEHEPDDKNRFRYAFVTYLRR